MEAATNGRARHLAPCVAAARECYAQQRLFARPLFAPPSVDAAAGGKYAQAEGTRLGMNEEGDRW